MTKRIFRTIFIVAVGVFLASVILFMTVLYDYFSVIGQNQLRVQIDLAAQGVANEGIGYFDGLEAQNCRITWIGTDGSVLYDSMSDADHMENHLEREEVKEALAEGYGESSRYSATLTERYLYSAKRLPFFRYAKLSSCADTGNASADDDHICCCNRTVRRLGLSLIQKDCKTAE